MLLVDAVAIHVFMHGDAAHGVELARGVGVLHITAQLDDEHPAVPVEGYLAGLLDVRIGEHGLDPEPRREPEPLGLLFRCQRLDRRLW